MLFRILRNVFCGTLTIRLIFEASDEMPCEHMKIHADEVVDAVAEEYEDSELPAAVVAFDIVDKYRRVERVEVTDEDGDIVVCSIEGAGL